MTQAGGQLPHLRRGVPEEPVVLVGEALDGVRTIIERRLPTSTPTDVVYRGIAFMLAALDKQVELRDPGSRTVEVIDLWSNA